MAGLEPDKARAVSSGKRAAVERAWNPPEVTSRDEGRDALQPEPPPTVGKLVKIAETAGWEAVITYARGDAVTTSGGGGSFLHSYVVRLARGDQRAVAAWEALVFSPCCGRRAGVKIWRVPAVGGLVSADTGVGLKWTAFRVALARYACGNSGRSSTGLTVLSDVDFKSFLKARDPREGVTPEEMERAAQALAGLSA